MNTDFAIVYSPPSAGSCPALAAAQTREDHLVVTPRFLGLGYDRIIGGTTGPRYRVIDLSLLSEPVSISWTGPQSGSITDGADSLVFQGVEEIILPACMRSAPRAA